MRLCSVTPGQAPHRGGWAAASKVCTQWRQRQAAPVVAAVHPNTQPASLNGHGQPAAMGDHGSSPNSTDASQHLQAMQQQIDAMNMMMQQQMQANQQLVQVNAQLLQTIQQLVTQQQQRAQAQVPTLQQPATGTEVTAATTAAVPDRAVDPQAPAAATHTLAAPAAVDQKVTKGVSTSDAATSVLKQQETIATNVQKTPTADSMPTARQQQQQAQSVRPPQRQAGPNHQPQENRGQASTDRTPGVDRQQKALAQGQAQQQQHGRRGGRWLPPPGSPQLPAQLQVPHGSMSASTPPAAPAPAPAPAPSRPTAPATAPSPSTSPAPRAMPAGTQRMTSMSAPQPRAAAAVGTQAAVTSAPAAAAVAAARPSAAPSAAGQSTVNASAAVDAPPTAAAATAGNTVSGSAIPAAATAGSIVPGTATAEPSSSLNGTAVQAEPRAVSLEQQLADAAARVGSMPKPELVLNRPEASPPARAPSVERFDGRTGRGKGQQGAGKQLSRSTAQRASPDRQQQQQQQQQQEGVGGQEPDVAAEGQLQQGRQQKSGKGMVRRQSKSPQDQAAQSQTAAPAASAPAVAAPTSTPAPAVHPTNRPASTPALAPDPVVASISTTAAPPPRAPTSTPAPSLQPTPAPVAKPVPGASATSSAPVNTAPAVVPTKPHKPPKSTDPSASAPAGSASHLAYRMRAGLIGPPAKDLVPGATAREVATLLTRARVTLNVTPTRDLLEILSWLSENKIMVDSVYVGELCGVLWGRVAELGPMDCVACLQALEFLMPEHTQPLTPRVTDPLHSVTYADLLQRLLLHASEVDKLPAQPTSGVAGEEGSRDVIVAAQVFVAVSHLVAKQPKLLQWKDGQLSQTSQKLLAHISSRPEALTQLEDAGVVLQLLATFPAIGLTMAGVPADLLEVMLSAVRTHMPTFQPTQFAQFASIMCQMMGDTSTRPAFGFLGIEAGLPQASQQPGWAADLVTYSQAHLQDMAFEDLAMLLHALVTAGYRPPTSWLLAVEAATLEKLPESQPAATANEMPSGTSSTPASFRVPLNKRRPAGTAQSKKQAGVVNNKGVPPTTASTTGAGVQPAALAQICVSMALLQHRPQQEWLARASWALGVQHASFPAGELVDTLWALCHMGCMPAPAPFNSLFSKMMAQKQALSSAQQVRAACLPTYLAAAHSLQPAAGHTLPSKWWDELQSIMTVFLSTASQSVGVPAATAGVITREELFAVLVGTVGAVSVVKHTASGKDHKGASKQIPRKLTPAYTQALYTAVEGYIGQWDSSQLLHLVPMLATVYAASSIAPPAASAIQQQLVPQFEAAVVGSGLTETITGARSQPGVSHTKDLTLTPVSPDQLSAVAGLMVACGHQPSETFLQHLSGVVQAAPVGSLTDSSLAGYIQLCDQQYSDEDSSMLLAALPVPWLQAHLTQLRSSSYLHTASPLQVLTTCSVLLSAKLPVPGELVSALHARLGPELITAGEQGFVLLLQVLGNVHTGNHPLPAASRKLLLARTMELAAVLSAHQLLWCTSACLRLVGATELKEYNVPAALDQRVHELVTAGASIGTQEGAMWVQLLTTFRACDYKPNDERMQQYMKRVQQHLPVLTAYQLAQICNFLTWRQYITDTQWTEALSAALLPQLPGADVQLLGVVLDYVALHHMLQVPISPALQAITDATLDQLQTHLRNGSVPPPHILVQCGNNAWQLAPDYALFGLVCQGAASGLADENQHAANGNASGTTSQAMLGDHSLLNMLMLCQQLQQAASAYEDESVTTALQGVQQMLRELQPWLRTHVAEVPGDVAISFLVAAASHGMDVWPETWDNLMGRVHAKEANPDQVANMAYLYLTASKQSSSTVASSNAVKHLGRLFRASIKNMDSVSGLATLSSVQFSNVVLAMHALQTAGQAALSDAEQHLLINSCVQQLIQRTADPDRTTSQLAAEVNVLAAVSAMTSPEVRGAVFALPVSTAFACRLFSTAPGDMTSVHSEARSMLIKELRVVFQTRHLQEEAEDAKANHDKARLKNLQHKDPQTILLPKEKEERLHKAADEAAESMCQQFVYDEPRLLVHPDFLLEVLTLLIRQPYPLSPAWLDTMTEAIQPSLLEPAHNNEWSLDTMCRLVHYLCQLDYEPKASFRSALAQATQKRMQQEQLQPSQATTLLWGFSRTALPQTWVSAWCRASLPYLHLLTNPEYLEVRHTTTPASGTDGEAQDADAASAGVAQKESFTVAGREIAVMMLSFIQLQMTPTDEWMTEFSKVFTLCSRRIAHKDLALTISHLCRLVPLYAQDVQITAADADATPASSTTQQAAAQLRSATGQVQAAQQVETKTGQQAAAGAPQRPLANAAAAGSVPLQQWQVPSAIPVELLDVAMMEVLTRLARVPKERQPAVEHTTASNDNPAHLVPTKDEAQLLSKARDALQRLYIN